MPGCANVALIVLIWRYAAKKYAAVLVCAERAFIKTS
jgi:hypothetical protein